MVSKKVLIIGVVVAIAAIGVIAGILVATSSSSSEATNESSNPTSANSDTPLSRATNSSKSGIRSNTTKSSGGPLITSDPTSAKFTLCAFALGDWGTTIYQDSCCTRAKTYNKYDVNAMDVVASIMNTHAGAVDVKPQCILGHGDNFYWTGIDSEADRDTRFTTTFEKKYNGDNIATIPFINVAGNHDYGGASFVCSDGKQTVECNDADELVAGLENKFKWQQEYVSPNDNRWILKDHFYVHTIEDKDSGVSIDIFNVDTGDADVHAAMQVCCQCFGYSKGIKNACKGVSRGHKYCAGGNNEMYDACFAKFEEWGADSRKQLAEKAATSTATWKIVNSHYSPHAHYDEAGMKEWFDVLQGLGIHAWVYGHTHGEKHDYSESLGMHFIENGAGGGIQMEAASGLTAYAEAYAKNVWTYSGDEYGFFSIDASTEWLKLQYHTADDSWSFGSNMEETKAGGAATKHCWYVPADGSEGQACTT